MEKRLIITKTNTPLFVVYAAAIFSIILYFSSSSLQTNQREWSLLLILLCLLPAFLYLLEMKRNKVTVNIPFLPIVGILYIFYYGIPGLLGDNFSVRFTSLSNEDINEAVFWTCVGWIALLAGYYLLKRIRLVSPLHINFADDRVERVAWILVGIGFSTMVMRSQGLFPTSLLQIARTFVFCVEAGLGLLILLSFRNQLGRRSKLLVRYLVFPLFLVSQLSTGLTSSFLIASSYLLMIVWGERRKVPWILLILLFFSVLLIRGVVDEYRYKVWYSNEQVQLGTIDRSLLMLNLIQKKIMGTGQNVGGKGNLRETGEFLLFKRSMLSTFAYTLHLTPDSIPFWYGYTYTSLLTTMIPRLLWPDKPKADLGQVYGHRYELLDPWDLATSMNLPQLIEFYINFNVEGVVIGMFLLGCIYQLLDQKINVRGSGDGTLLIAAIVFSRMMNVESDFSMIFGQVIQMIIIYYFTFRVLGRV